MNNYLMAGFFLLLLIFLMGGFGVVVYWMRSQRQSESSSQLLMQQQMEALRVQVGSSIAEVSQVMNRRLEENRTAMERISGDVGSRLDNAGQVIAGVQNKLGSLEEATRGVIAVKKSIEELSDSLKVPKFRGGVGELFLADLLAEMLPRSNFKLQHRFANGEIVDAVVILGEGMVPVDSKFPLENFKRLLEAEEADRSRAKKAFYDDVKKHIDAIAGKYIRPQEGTFDFALMYIPAENVYYETIIKDERRPEDSKAVSTYALSRRVIPVSPNSFYAYLQAILLGLKGMQVEENARRILDGIQELSSRLDIFQEDFRVLGRHLNNARSKYDEAEKRLIHFGDRLENMQTAGPVGLESDEAEPPSLLS